MTAARVSAIVVNYNDREHLLECVRSLRSEGVKDLIVADNDSSDGSPEALEEMDPEVTVVPVGGNFGYPVAANRGASRSSGELLLICNSDVTVEDGAVVALAAAMDADERFGVVGPRIMDPDGSLYPSPRRFPAMGVALGHAFLGLFAPRNRYTRRYRMLDWQQQPGPVDWVSGACFMCRRDAWDSLGGLDEAYFLYAEDVDLCWRAWKAGWKVGFEPAARVTHIGGATTSLAPYRFIVLHHRSALRFSRRYLTGWRQVLLPFTTIGLGVRLVLACAQRAARGLRDH
ncbi:MAG: glycosyltransferase family 2 protein [Actinomycetota bacterium]|nr:glycosyltransferase family 2 protein [Actinomycetota bacterium]